MSKPFAYGIDFGTTNTVVSAAYGDRVEVLGIGDRQSETVPSVLLIDESTRNFAIGESAWRQMMINPAGKRFVFAIKGALAEPHLDSKVMGAVWTPEDFLLKVLQLLKRDADRAVATDVRRAVLGHPVAFEGAEGPKFKQRQALAMKRLESAARRAGFDEVELMAEPAAALPIASSADGSLLTVDFGGGTFDVMAARIKDGTATATGLRGVAVGGQRFDAEIFRTFVSEQMGLERDYHIDGKHLPFPSWIRTGFCNWLGLQKLMRDPTISRDIRVFLRAPGGDTLTWLKDVVRGGQAHRFLRALEAAKIDLTSMERAEVVFDWSGFSRRLPADRSEFSEAISDDISKCMSKIEETLQAAGMSEAEVTKVVCTGGSAQVPAFRAELEARFGRERMTDAPFFSSVARGLGEYAQECWS